MPHGTQPDSTLPQNWYSPFVHLYSNQMHGKDHRRRQMEMKCDFHKEVNLSAISSSRRSSRSFQKGCNDGLPTPFEPCELGPNTGGTSKASNPRSIIPARWRAQCNVSACLCHKLLHVFSCSLLSIHKDFSYIPAVASPTCTYPDSCYCYTIAIRPPTLPSPPEL
jgi:hypothetical protein